MRCVGSSGTEHQFGIRGERDIARNAAMVGECHTAQFSVPFAGYRDIQSSRDHVVATVELRAPFGKRRAMHTGVAARKLQTGLQTRRPDRAAGEIAQQHVVSPAIASRVFAPAGNCKFAPTTKARTCRGQHDCISGVRKQLRVVRGDRNRLRAKGHQAVYLFVDDIHLFRMLAPTCNCVDAAPGNGCQWFNEQGSMQRPAWHADNKPAKLLCLPALILHYDDDDSNAS